jgi:leader peptidase (prepilin peptidase) / N-methyltransferase
MGRSPCEGHRRVRRFAPSVPLTAPFAVAVGLLGLVVGAVVNRAAGRFPWTGEGTGEPAVRQPVVELGTAVLFVLVALRFGWSWELPAFLFPASAAVLLAVVDLQHRLLPDRVVLPSIAIGAVLLFLAAVPDHAWADLLRGVLAGVVLFTVYLMLALINPRGLGMGDVKLAALLGLYLGWLGWPVVASGTVAAFLAQALIALVLLATRRIGLRGELPFGPAMLLGAAVAIGWSDALLS